MKKVVFGVIIIIILAVIAGAGYLKFMLPDVGKAPELVVDSTPARIKHGEYLANHVTACMDCHSTRNWSLYSGPISPGTLGKGGEYFGPEMGFPGKFYSRNITPAKLANWTDGEIFRAITTGVDKNGKALFPVMPYLSYGQMDKEDIYDIIAYIRSIPPIENEVEASKADFPMNFIMNTIPAKASFVEKPASSDSLKYGAYLANAAACMECHTQVDKGQIIPTLAYSGGREFVMPVGTVRSANITPDMETGIGMWTEAAFVQRFKLYADEAQLEKVSASQLNTIMPWAMYAGMDSTDLKSIYVYLKSLKPIKNEVVHFSQNLAQR
jgi:mono/diheme cytochrome c family protein